MSIVPYILSSNCEEHYPWIEKVLGAKVAGEMLRDKEAGQILHMQMSLEGHDLYLSDNIAPTKQPKIDKQSGKDSKTKIAAPQRPATDLCVYVDSQNIDEIYARALANGATVTMELDNQSWGQRWCQFVDPFGIHWMIGKELEHKPVEAPAETTPSKTSNKASAPASKTPTRKRTGAS